MTVRAAIRRQLIRRHLRERAPVRGRVDRERGIVYGVKIVGRHSPNTHGVHGAEGTEYELEALAAALPLYENVNVNVDHPPRGKPGMERSARDRFAWLENCEVMEAGIFGDLHFLDPTDPLAVRVLNAAELHPEAFALSHNAVGKGEVRNRRYVVTEIPEVHSVDLVSDGGTNRSLFESRTMPVTIADHLRENVLPALKAGRRKRLQRIIAALPATALMEAEGEKDHLDHLYDAMRSAKKDGHDEVAGEIHKVMHPDKHDLEEEEPEGEKEEEEEEEDGEGRERSEMEGQGDEGPGEPGAHNEGPDGRGGPATAWESRRRKKKVMPGHVVLNEKQCVQLCRTAGVEATSDVVTAIREARSFDGQMAVINLAKRSARAAAPPRSVGRGGVALQESATPRADDVKGWLARLRS